MAKTKERFFIPRPERDANRLAPIYPDAKPGDEHLCPVYLAGKTRLLWSGADPLPQLNEVVKTPFGTARVEGFFSSSGFVGVMVAPDAPPRWWIEQNEERAALPVSDDNPEWLSRLACFFGAELR